FLTRAVTSYDLRKDARLETGHPGDVACASGGAERDETDSASIPPCGVDSGAGANDGRRGRHRARAARRLGDPVLGAGAGPGRGPVAPRFRAGRMASRERAGTGVPG